MPILSYPKPAPRTHHLSRGTRRRFSVGSVDLLLLVLGLSLFSCAPQPESSQRENREDRGDQQPAYVLQQVRMQPRVIEGPPATEKDEAPAEPAANLRAEFPDLSAEAQEIIRLEREAKVLEEELRPARKKAPDLGEAHGDLNQEVELPTLDDAVLSIQISMFNIVFHEIGVWC
ncbi:MAG: hypothetical protein AAFY88_11625, partial [Acidobacteriota bacterium]